MFVRCVSSPTPTRPSYPLPLGSPYPGPPNRTSSCLYSVRTQYAPFPLPLPNTVPSVPTNQPTGPIKNALNRQTPRDHATEWVVVHTRVGREVKAQANQTRRPSSPPPLSLSSVSVQDTPLLLLIPFLLKDKKPPTSNIQFLLPSLATFLSFIPYAVFLFLGNPIALLACTSPSASHLLALTNWTTLIICFVAITGKLTPASTHGQKLSILFARASSSAPALYGLVKICRSRDELTWAPWWIAAAVWSGTVWRREGERSGEEKERR